MSKKQSFSMEKQAQIVTVSNLKFSVCQITKKMKVRETAKKYLSPDIFSSLPESSMIFGQPCMV